ncbi:hypothetical protein RND71_023269 [Anisodus tanguticus]|uniref:Uncharacterized protein n=1 Tax=Anisodus tanguticus TaxID=243964 RepID=A0AAE1RSA9_9SOLA|nr:hypothetical protein RND71_023269 [Anisodus tanguticus]
MTDQIQHQLAQLVNLFQEERTANLARQQAINARLDALTKDSANSKTDCESTENITIFTRLNLFSEFGHDGASGRLNLHADRIESEFRNIEKRWVQNIATDEEFTNTFPLNMKGKVVLITGASSGIGEELAYEYARRGSSLTIVARRENRLGKVAERAKSLGSPDILSIRADVSNVEDCKRFVDQTVKHFGRCE